MKNMIWYFAIQIFFKSKIRTATVIITMAVLLFLQAVLFELHTLVPHLPITKDLHSDIWISTERLNISKKDIQIIQQNISPDTIIIPVQLESATTFNDLTKHASLARKLMTTLNITEQNDYNSADNNYQTIELISIPYDYFDDLGIDYNPGDMSDLQNGFALVTNTSDYAQTFISRGNSTITINNRQIPVIGIYHSDEFVSDTVVVADQIAGQTVFSTDSVNNLLILHPDKTENITEIIKIQLPNATIESADLFTGSLKNTIFPPSWISLFQVVAIFISIMQGAIVSMLLYIHTLESRINQTLIRTFGGTKIQLVLILFSQILLLILSSILAVGFLHYPLFALLKLFELIPSLTIGINSYILSIETNIILIMFMSSIPLRIIFNTTAKINPHQTDL